MIDKAEWAMEPHVKALWDRIKIAPEKWQHSPEGDEGRGFWVVALIGKTCIYYNDIEEGFNDSEYEQFGHIKNYYCNQADLLTFINWYYQQFIKAISP